MHARYAQTLVGGTDSSDELVDYLRFIAGGRDAAGSRNKFWHRVISFGGGTESDLAFSQASATLDAGLPPGQSKKAQKIANKGRANSSPRGEIGAAIDRVSGF